MSEAAKSTSRSIYLDTNSAQNEMKKLQTEADKLKLKLDSGELSGDKLNKTLAKFDTVNAKIKSVQDQLDKGLGPSLKQQQSLVQTLNNELSRMSQSDPQFAAKAKIYQEQNKLLGEMREKLTGVKKAGEEMGSTFSKVFTHVAEVATAYFAFESIKEGLTEFVESSIEEAEQAEKSITRLENVLANLGRSDAFDNIIAKADELASEFKHLDNDDIIEVFQQLITYGKLTEKQMNDLLPLIIDFAAKSGTSINESASVIIKALEGNSKALKEYGITIKDGHTVTERFGILMSELGPKVQGAAKAFEETTGKAAVTKQAIADIKEEVGKELLPALYAFYNVQLVIISGLQTIFETVKRSLSNGIAFFKLAAGILKDAATLDLNSGTLGQRIAQFDKELVAINEVSQAETNRIEIQKTASSVASDAAKKSVKEQEAILKNALAMKEASFKLYNDLANAGKQNTKEGHDAAVQLATDAAVVVALQKTIAQSKDTRTFGGDPNADPEADKKAAAEHEKLLKEVEAFNKKLHDLNFQSQQASKTDDQKEIDAIKEKYARIFEEYKALAKKIKGSGLSLTISPADLTGAENDELQATITKQKAKHDKEQQEAFLKNVAFEYENQKALSDKFFEEQKEKESQRFVTGEIDRKQYEANIAAIDVASKQQQIRNAQDYSGVLEKAAVDVSKFKKEELQKETAEHLAALVKQLADEKLFRDLQNQAATSRNKTNLALSAPGSPERLAAQKAGLEEEKRQELAALAEKEKAYKQAGIAYTNEFNDLRKDINDKYRKEELNADLETINQDLEYAKQVVGVFEKFSQAKTNRENADLKNELKNNDTRKAGLKRQLDSKLISQQEYNRQVSALDADAEAKKDALAKKQFERNKKFQLAQAAISGAQSVIKTIEEFGPPLFPNFLGIGAMILTLATIAGEVTAITSAKYAGGGKVDHPGNGRINVGSNIPTQPNGDDVLATVKRGEVILNEDQQHRLGGANTFRSIGVPGFAGGGPVLKPFWQTRPYRSIDTNRVTNSMQVLKFATGGLVASATTDAGQPPTAPQTDPALLAALERQEAINLAVMNTLQNLNGQLEKGITTEFSLKKYDDRRALKDRISEDAQFR